MIESNNYKCYVLIGISVPVLIFVAYVLSWVVLTDDQTSLANPPGSRATTSLQFVIVVARHGSRGALTTYPLFPYNPTDIWPYGPGQLTNRGRVKMLDLGVRIRSLYNGFLNKLYSPDDVSVFSTLEDRTLMSAEVFLAGLYPPRAFQMWDADLLWQPIPVYPTYLIHKEINTMSGKGTLCPVYQKAQNQSVQNFERTEGPKIVAMLSPFENYTGISVTPTNVLNSLYIVWESIYNLVSDGRPLPSWTTSVYPEPLTTSAVKLFSAILIGSDAMIRPYLGFLYQEMIRLMRAKTDGDVNNNKRLYFYSAHDSVVMGLQAILGLPGARTTVVNTGSAMIFELHEHPTKQSFYIQVVYIDGFSKDLEPTVVNIPGCDFPCDFYQLAKNTERFYNLTDLETECALNESVALKLNES